MKNDQIFTPSFIVDKMLTMINFGPQLLASYSIIEPSFGDGAFILPIVKKVLSYAQTNNLSIDEVKNMLNNIYGVEIDKKYYDEAIEKLNYALSDFGIDDFQWEHLYNQDLLDYKPEILFDFVIGNPPYIRIHDLPADIRTKIHKEYSFCSGSTDIYITFFEWGLKHLSQRGKLCFITPNSWLNNSSQKLFRNYLKENSIINSIVDYHKLQVFEAISTYTAITLLDKSQENQNIKYTKMKTLLEEDFSLTKRILDLNDTWSFSNQKDEKFLSKINSKNNFISDFCIVQNGIATNADKVYIVNNDQIKTMHLEKDILRPIIKASTLEKNHFIIFPYLWDNQKQKYIVIDEDTLKSKYKNVYQYLNGQKSLLLKRDLEKDSLWYQFGRSQGLQNSNHKKLVIQHIISPEQSTCRIKEVDANCLVYSGIYIVVNDETKYDYIKSVLKSKRFCRYVKLLGKDMSGGYKSFNTKVIKDFKI